MALRKAGPSLEHLSAPRCISSTGGAGASSSRQLGHPDVPWSPVDGRHGRWRSGQVRSPAHRCANGPSPGCRPGPCHDASSSCRWNDERDATTVGNIEMVTGSDLAAARDEYAELAGVTAEIPTIVLNKTYSPLKAYAQARSATLTDEGVDQARDPIRHRRRRRPPDAAPAAIEGREGGPRNRRDDGARRAAVSRTRCPERPARVRQARPGTRGLTRSNAAVACHVGTWTRLLARHPPQRPVAPSPRRSVVDPGPDPRGCDRA